MKIKTKKSTTTNSDEEIIQVAKQKANLSSQATQEEIQNAIDAMRAAVDLTGCPYYRAWLEKLEQRKHGLYNLSSLGMGVWDSRKNQWYTGEEDMKTKIAKSKPKKKTDNVPRVPDSWIEVFEKNEKVKKANRMTDEQITQWMIERYGRDSKTFHHVSHWRKQYNAGKLPGQNDEVPIVQSKRYDENGEPIPDTRSKMGISDSWVEVFEKNEKVKKANRMTDEQITQWMMDRHGVRKAFNNVDAFRRMYNRGRIRTQNGEVPIVQSKRYDENGEPMLESKSEPKGKSKPKTKAKSKKTKTKIKSKK